MGLPAFAIKALSEPKGVKGGAIGAKYDPTQTYSQGDLVYKSGKIYRALEDAITGEWDPTKWEQTDILEQLMELIQQGGSISAIGRFLSDWNCVTGKPETNPPSLPYTYLTGDYYIIGTIASGSGTNYMPSGTQYTGAASTTVDTGTPAILSMYRFDGTTWTYLDFGQAFRTYLNNYYTKGAVDNLIANNKQVYVVDYANPNYAAAVSAITANKLVITWNGASGNLFICNKRPSSTDAALYFYQALMPTQISAIQSNKFTMAVSVLLLSSANVWTSSTSTSSDGATVVDSTIPSTPTDTKLPTTKLMHDQDELRIAKTNIDTTLPSSRADDRVPSTKLMNNQDELRIPKADIDTSIPTAPTNSKVPSTKLIHDQDELRIAKTDINTTLPATPTDTKVPSTKLMHAQDELRIPKANIDTSMPTTPSNDKVPSTKLVNDLLEDKADAADIIPAQIVVCYDQNGTAHTYSINMQEVNL